MCDNLLLNYFHNWAQFVLLYPSMLHHCYNHYNKANQFFVHSRHNFEIEFSIQEFSRYVCHSCCFYGTVVTVV